MKDGHATVDDDARPVQEAGGGKTGTECHLCNLFGLPVTTQGNLALGIDDLRFIGNGRRHRGVDRTGTDRVHVDAMPTEFGREALRQPDDTVLRR